jgi:ABC-type multidrug transport system fused ATPase/permease subunit
MRYDFLIASFNALITECMSLTYIYSLTFLINYLKDETAEVKQGIMLAAGFCLLVITSGLMRNYYVFQGYLMAIKVRKILISAMFDKVGLLSTKSLTETNSGKLVTLISSDIFGVERALSHSPIVFAAPIISLTAFILIGSNSGW